MDLRYCTERQLRESMSALPFSSPLVVLSESAAKRWGLYDGVAGLHGDGKAKWFSSPDPNPTARTVHRALRMLRGFTADGIVAIGGGSAMDLAKAVSAFHGMPGPESPESLLRSIVGKAYLGNRQNALPVVAVPTTAGTGSEVTQWATVWGSDGSSKQSVDAPWLKPAQVWMAPCLLASLPRRAMLCAGLDAVCHAAEAYWAKASNPLSKALSVRALQAMARFLKPALSNRGDMRVLENLCTGSLMAGLAFSMTRTAACHAISYPLTYMFGIEHGFAAALTLAQVAETNQAACDISEINEVFSGFGGIQAWLDGVCEGIVSLRLGAFGVGSDDMEGIVSNCFNADRMGNNPVDLSIGDVTRILDRVR